jgi:hypothetical protein
MAVYFVKASGKTSRKVFKLDRVTLPPRQGLDMRANVSLAIHTTRKPNPGKHAVEVLVNGAAYQAGSFHVIASRKPQKAH